MTGERLARCRTLIEDMAERSLEDRAEILEFVHESLTAELDDLARRDQATDGRQG